MSIVILTNVSEFIDEMLELDYSDNDLSDYYCINIKPFKCSSCKEVICYFMVGPHYILLWPTKYDDELLEVAKVLAEHDYDPNIIRYSELYGRCVTWEDAENAGWVESIFS